MSNEMICVCSPEGEAEAEARRLRICAVFGVQPKDFATALVLSLGWDFGLEIEVYADQWFGVSASRGDEWGEGVECDDPIDGMAWIWEKAAERFGYPHPRGMPDGVLIASDALLSAVRTTDALWKEHKAACDQCRAEGFKLCAEGRRLWMAQSDASIALRNQWGSPTDKEAPRFYGFDELDAAA